MANNSISGVAYELYYELEQPTSPTSGYIYNWLLFNVGKLNNWIDKNYSSEDGDDYTPQLGVDEKGILKEVYWVDYYNQKARKALLGIDDNSKNIVSLKDDKSSVQFVNNKDLAKTYREVAEDHNNNLITLVNSYKRNRSGPREAQYDISGYKWK